ncbi:hypothetical protein BC567DRAFT_251239 [Phyllosticta citribraziliensis]
MDSLKEGIMHVEVQELLAGVGSGDHVSKDRFRKAVTIIKGLQQEILRKNYELARAEINHHFEQRTDSEIPVASRTDMHYEQENNSETPNAANADTPNDRETCSEASADSRTDARYGLRRRPIPRQEPETTVLPVEEELEERHLPPIPASAFIIRVEELRQYTGTGGDAARRVRKTLEALPHRRTAILMTGRREARDIGSRHSKASAAVLQLAGLHQRIPCNPCCKAGAKGRAFVGCRAVPGFFSGSCANCVYNDSRQSCDCSSYDPDEQPMTVEEYRKARGEDLEVDEGEEHISRLESIVKVSPTTPTTPEPGLKPSRYKASPIHFPSRYTTPECSPKPVRRSAAENPRDTGNRNVERKHKEDSRDIEHTASRKKKGKEAIVQIPAKRSWGQCFFQLDTAGSATNAKRRDPHEQNSD